MNLKKSESPTNQTNVTPATVAAVAAAAVGAAHVADDAEEAAKKARAVAQQAAEALGDLTGDMKSSAANVAPTVSVVTPSKKKAATAKPTSQSKSSDKKVVDHKKLAPAKPDVPAGKKADKKAETPTPVAAAAKPEKKPAGVNPLRNVYAKKSDKAQAKVGDREELFLLETPDLKLKGDERIAKIKETKAVIDQAAIKEGDKIHQLLGWIASGASAEALNKVMAITFQTMQRDGRLTSGDKGNLQKELLKHYTIGTARSQANQMFGILPKLKIGKKSEKGLVEPNPKSTLLPRIVEKFQTGSAVAA